MTGMNVSFGKMNFRTEGQKLTPKQNYTNEFIDDVCCYSADEGYSLHGSGETCNIRDLADIDLKSDIVILNKKNGDTVLTLKEKDKDDFRETFGIDGFPKGDRPQVLLSAKNSLNKIKDKIGVFISDIKALSDKYYCLKEDNIDKTIEAEMDMLKNNPDEYYARQEAINALGDEDAFVKEFGTDYYN